jgi:ADP-ribosyl-[dinitrogen reductase] hydrolase
LLNEFLERGVIRLARTPLLECAPGPMPPDFDYGRVEGMMLGLAIGDALGNTSESMLPEERRALYGEIRDYLPNRHAGNRPVGLPSDDTQLAFWTLEQMLTDGGFEPARTAERFTYDQIYGIGDSVRTFLWNYKSGMPWYECGPESAGNGALMRIASMLIPHLRTGTAELWADAALSAMITHNDSASNAACVAFVWMLWDLLQMDRPPEPDWWLHTYVDTARTLETGQAYQPRGGSYTSYSGPLWRFAEERVGEAHLLGLSTLDACNAWHSGAYLLETVPGVLYILMCYGDQPEEAIIRAVNDTRDNDTIAAIVGAAVGALHGIERLPGRWVSGLLGRTGADDDGQVCRLLDWARSVFWVEHDHQAEP